MAINHDKAVVPVVTAGAGEGAFVLTDGERLASAVGLDRALRYKVLPVSLSVPWGLSLGLSGLLPYLPLPSKLVTAILPPMRPAAGEDAAGFAQRVEDAMQSRMDDLVANRIPLLG